MKYLLQPTARQTVALDHLLWMQRNLYNASLAERRDTWRIDHRSISRYEQFASLNGMAETNPELGRYGVCVARGTLTRLDLAFQSFYRRCKRGESPGHPRFKGRWRWDSVTWPDSSGWKLEVEAKRFYAQGIGHMKAKLHRGLPGRPKTATLKREGRRWWVVVVCDQVPAEVLAKTNKAVGIDLGVAQTLTTSDGDHVANPRPGQRAAEGLAKAQRALTRKSKGSARRRKAVARVAAHHRKVANCRADHAHQVSRALVDASDLIAHEDLSITNMVKSATGTWIAQAPTSPPSVA